MNLDNIRALNEAVNELAEKAHKKMTYDWWERLAENTSGRLEEAELGYCGFYAFLHERFDLLRDIHSPTVKIETGIKDPRYDEYASIVFVVSEKKPGIYLYPCSFKSYRLKDTVCETTYENNMGYMDCEHYFTFLEKWDSIQESAFDEAFYDKCVNVLTDRITKAKELLAEE